MAEKADFSPSGAISSGRRRKRSFAEKSGSTILRVVNEPEQFKCSLNVVLHHLIVRDWLRRRGIF